MRPRKTPAGMVVVLLVALSSGAAPAADGAPDFALPNGLRVRMVPLKGSNEVAVLLGVRAGLFDEPSGLPHPAHVAEHVVFFGAPPEGEQGKAVSRWFEAGKANAETLPALMYFDLQVGAAELGMALRVQAARLSGPELSEAVLAREIPRALAEVESLERPEVAGTGKFAFSAFVQAAVHGRAEVPIKAATRAITVEDVRRFHARTFRPDRAMLVIIGGFDPDEARRAVGDLFGAIPGPADEPAPPQGARLEGPMTARWDAATRHLTLAWRTPPASEPDHAALTLAATALQRRLFLDRGPAMPARSPIVTNEVEGFFLVNVPLDPGSDGEAARAALLGRVRRLGEPEGFGEADFGLARREFAASARPGFVATLVLAAKTSPLLARTQAELQGLTRAIVWGDLDAYFARVEALDAAKVRDAVRRLLGPDRAIVVRVEPR